MLDTITLTEFELEVLETLQGEGPLHEEPGRTLCEIFGYDNSRQDELHRALRELVKKGLVQRLDGTRNAMRSLKRLSFSCNRVTGYKALTTQSL